MSLRRRCFAPINVARHVLQYAFAALLLTISAALPAATLIEYYHKDLDHYFITGFAAEIQALDAGVHKGWARTGQTIEALDPGAPGFASALTVCRFYGNPLRGLDSHFYSANKTECDAVQQKWPEAWLLESADAFRVQAVDSVTGGCPAGTKAVHRLFNKRADINHRYTTDSVVFDAMIAKGYTPEGSGSPQRPVVFCAVNTAAPAQPAGALPACTIVASTVFPVPNSPVTLTATCTNSPTTYAWTNCTSTTGNCVATATFAGSVSYGVVATNAAGSSAPATLALDWQAAASAGPACTVSASNAAPTLGTGLTLNSSCSHSPTKFQWLGCSALVHEACNPLSECKSSTTSCSPIGVQAGPIWYALTASNSAGISEKSGVNVDWRVGSTAPPPPSAPTPTPSCTITPSTTTPSVKTTLTLTAGCTNNPTGYQWVNCTPDPQAVNRCTTTETAAVSRIYRVQGVNASGVGFPSEVTINWRDPPTAPPVCTVSASSPTPYVGGSLTLTANCSQSPTSYSWTNCSSSSATCFATAAQTGAASYSVTGTNGFGTGAPASAQVNWTTPPPSGADFCGQYAKVVRVNLTWGGHFDTFSNGGFPADAVFVGQISVPQDAKGAGSGLVSVVEYVDGQADRIMTLSPSACDFRGFKPNAGGPVDSTGANNPLAWAYGINPNTFFGLTGSSGSGPRLDPGRTYYVNIRNRTLNDASSCLTTNCNVRITVNRPQ